MRIIENDDGTYTLDNVSVNEMIYLRFALDSHVLNLQYNNPKHRDMAEVEKLRDYFNEYI
jgi:hypothetical protein